MTNKIEILKTNSSPFGLIYKCIWMDWNMDCISNSERPAKHLEDKNEHELNRWIVFFVGLVLKGLIIPSWVVHLKFNKNSFTHGLHITKPNPIFNKQIGSNVSELIPKSYYLKKRLYFFISVVCNK